MGKNLIPAVLICSALQVISGSARAEHQPWPINGRVFNESNAPATVWSDDRGVYQIAAHSRSDWWSEDVDHIVDIHGQWWKIGPYNATVNAAGEVTGFGLCRVSTYGRDCGQ